MLAIFRKHALGFFSHIVTYSLLAGMHITHGRPPLFVSVVLMLPLWATSSILWSEKDESEDFLRTLPLTSRDIARAKFSLALGALVVYWIILATVLTIVTGGTRDFVLGFVLMNIVWSAALLLVALWYAAIWFFGVKPMMPVMLAAIGGFFLTAISYLNAVRRTEIMSLSGLPALRILAGVPWYAGPMIAVAAVVVYFALMRMAARGRTVAISM